LSGKLNLRIGSRNGGRKKRNFEADLEGGFVGNVEAAVRPMLRGL
jgi:hypothetical protein